MRLLHFKRLNRSPVQVDRGGRGRRKLAIVALARKILIICWGMLKTNTPFPQSAALPALTSELALE